jgi:hypothetical protein
VVVPSAQALIPGSVYARSGAVGRVAAIGGDLLALCGIVLCIPFVILGIGIPIALFVQLLLWIGRLF